MGSYYCLIMLIATLVTYVGAAGYDTHEVFDFDKLDYPRDNNTVLIHVTVLKARKSIEILCPQRRKGVKFNLLPNNLDTLSKGLLFVYATIDGVYQRVQLEQIMVDEGRNEPEPSEHRAHSSRFQITNNGSSLFRKHGIDSIDLHCGAANYVKTIAASVPGCLEDKDLMLSGSYRCPCYSCGRRKAPLLGIVRIMLTSIPELIPGCGTKMLPFFINSGEAPNTNTYDVMDVDTIGFYCEGEILPNDCPFRMFDDKDEPMKLMFKGDVTSKKYGKGTLLEMSYDRTASMLPFSGHCKCVDTTTGVINAVISLQRKNEYVCDLRALFMRHLENPIIGDWCDVILYPGRKLNIIFPVDGEHYVYSKGENDGDASTAILSSTLLPPHPSIYAFVRRVSNNVASYKEVSIERYFDSGVLDLESSLDRLGILVLTNTMINGSPKMDFGSFYYRCFISHTAEDKFSADIMANIKITVKPQKDYGSVYEDYSSDELEDVEPNICRDPWIRHTCFPPIIYQYYPNNRRNRSIRCSSRGTMVPDGCHMKAFDATRKSVILFPNGVSSQMKSTTSRGHKIVVDDAVVNPFSMSCSCVNDDGIEISRFEIHKLRQRRADESLVDAQVMMVPHVEMVNIGGTNLRYSMDIIPIADPVRKTSVYRLATGDELTIKCTPPAYYRSRMRISITNGHQPFYADPDNTILDLNEETEKMFISSEDDPAFSQAVWFPIDSNQYYSLSGTGNHLMLNNMQLDATTITAGGFMISTYEELGGSTVNRSKFTVKYPKSAIVISYSGVPEINLRFVCGSVSPRRDIPENPAKERFNSFKGTQTIAREDRSMEIWEITNIVLPTTDPYVRGCGVPGDQGRLFKPDTNLLRDSEGHIAGCQVNMKTSSVAGFYCPLPYRTDPPDCRPRQPSPRGPFGRKGIVNIEVGRSANFYLFTKGTEFSIAEKIMKSSISVYECHCITITGKRISTIRLVKL